MLPYHKDRPRTHAQFTRRLVRLALRGGRLLEGNVHATEGQSLAVYLSTRRYLTSLTEARWIGPDRQVMPHMAVRSEKLLWAASLDDAFPVATNARPTAKPRWAELTLDDGSMLRVGLFIAEEQRMTDYFDAAPAFLPVLHASEVGSDRLLGPVAVNMSAILGVREIEPHR